MKIALLLLTLLAGTVAQVSADHHARHAPIPADVLAAAQTRPGVDFVAPDPNDELGFIMAPAGIDTLETLELFYTPDSTGLAAVDSILTWSMANGNRPVAFRMIVEVDSTGSVSTDRIGRDMLDAMAAHRNIVANHPEAFHAFVREQRATVGRLGYGDSADAAMSAVPQLRDKKQQIKTRTASVDSTLSDDGVAAYFGHITYSPTLRINGNNAALFSGWSMIRKVLNYDYSQVSLLR